MNPTPHYDTIIIGAGITGLKLAKEHQSAGKKVVILEKSKGLGGRLATRRMDDLGFDHGALKLNPPENFQNLFHTLNIQPSILEDGIYLAGGMSNLAKKMAVGLEIFREKKVTQIQRKGEHWQLICEDQSLFTAPEVFLTAPVPQALELIDSSKISLAADHPVRSILYHKALILIVVVKIGTNPKGLTQPPTPSNTHRIFAMNDRGLHPQGLVIQFSPEFSELHFEKTELEIFRAMQIQLKESDFDLDAIEKHEVKKWRYSIAKSTFPEPSLEVASNFFLSGDGFGNSNHSEDPN